MLLFKRGKVLRTMEEGLRWNAAGVSVLPQVSKAPPEGVFVAVPRVYDRGQFDQYLKALEAEAWHMLGNGSPRWAQLYGDGVYELPMDRIRAVVQAVGLRTALLGLELDPAMLEPGAVAGYRSIGVERFCFRDIAPIGAPDEPVRRARALGAFTSAEICYGGTLAGRPYLQAVERSLTASPNQVYLSDARSRGAFGAELLEKAGELCASAGYVRKSVWLWTKSAECFDALAWMLSGECVSLGPCAVNLLDAVYANPGMRQWMQSRLEGNFEAIRAGGRLENWLSLAAGLYNLELRRESLDTRMYRHALALERMGIVDRKGHPSPGLPMEFCHRASRAARQALEGFHEPDLPAARLGGEIPAAGREDY